MKPTPKRALHPKLAQRAAATKAAHAHLTANKPGYAKLPMAEKMKHMQAHVRKTGGL